jgi:hypothetical protein
MAASSLRERIELALVEEMNKVQLSEPQNSVPAFIERASARLEEICRDEAKYGNRKS